MGWFGAALVGAMIGLAGWRLHPKAGGFSVWLTMLMTAAAAVSIKLAGNLTGWLIDGATLEWCVTVGAAIAVVTAAGFMRTRRPG